MWLLATIGLHVRHDTTEIFSSCVGYVNWYVRVRKIAPGPVNTSSGKKLENCSCSSFSSIVAHACYVNDKEIAVTPTDHPDDSLKWPSCRKSPNR